MLPPRLSLVTAPDAVRRRRRDRDIFHRKAPQDELDDVHVRRRRARRLSVRVGRDAPRARRAQDVGPGPDGDRGGRVQVVVHVWPLEELRAFRVHLRPGGRARKLGASRARARARRATPSASRPRVRPRAHAVPSASRPRGRPRAHAVRFRRRCGREARRCYDWRPNNVTALRGAAHVDSHPRPAPFPAQPFCDGSHKGSAFKPQQLKNETAEAKTFYVCSCGHSKTGAGLCDGSHRKIKEKV